MGKTDPKSVLKDFGQGFYALWSFSGQQYKIVVFLSNILDKMMVFLSNILDRMIVLLRLCLNFVEFTIVIFEEVVIDSYVGQVCPFAHRYGRVVHIIYFGIRNRQEEWTVG